jgi:hypothetical protein
VPVLVKDRVALGVAQKEPVGLYDSELLALTE